VSFFRSNLVFRVIPKDYTEDKDTMLKAWQTTILEYIQARKNDTGIVYCLSRDDAESMAFMVSNFTGIPAAYYHAGMSSGQRMVVQNKWRTGAVKIVAATIAFGMGIDHPHVRYVLHATMSKSLEGYYQEAGRCGRDGQKGECILFYGKRDGPRILNLIRRGQKKGSSFQRQLALFNAVVEYCTEGKICRHAQLLNYLGERQVMTCKNTCDVCLDEVILQADKEKKQKKRKEISQNDKTGSASLPGFTSARMLKMLQS
jgi:bloom syndrome protein